MSPFGYFAATGVMVAVIWLKGCRRHLGLTENEFWVAIWLMALSGILGAKALFVLLGWPHYASGELRFWADFGTGFVYFGGLLGALLSGAIFAHVRGLNFWRSADYFAVALPAAHALGRVGCFFTGCCPGRPPHPVPLYEAAGLVGISLVCFALLRQVKLARLAPGSAFCGYMLCYGILRLGLDPLRADGRPERFWGFSHQQGIAMGLLLFAVVSFLVLNRSLASRSLGNQ